MSRKPGDWNCPSCDHLNFGWRESCQRCNEAKSGSGGHTKAGNDGYGGGRDDERGDYRRRGSSYGFGSGYNSGGSGSYHGRSDSRGSGSRDDYRSGSRDDYRSGYDSYNRSFGSSYGGSDVRPGDWHCQEGRCGAHNFASRSNCFKCGAPKDEGGENARGGSYDYGRGGGYDRGSRGGFGRSYDSGDAGSGRSGWKSGDWMCTRSGCNEHNFASRTECFRCQAPREAV
ncbi:hypothetical protein KP509_08G008000 [Ceratopteris richardii]|uniref:RanBP2-type domain-containing protein n=1 Tax=Ceratopteris richardii TaxID=49495 RepID=A0A8T2U3E7_CERRI|nr:hypothetical protein KP509_08G008000 [Ceratopteris richardii]KAH7430669.1 hypothetical protein KP509_08G008000 [Ceratopteris richardii]KAH7430670.1 hypothetical protein KP509_08G008000 [Ceratopteris richardii]KAH7430671.1 hypothetical protein KP509_08G008000 [Ceratopteris richardii]